MLHDSLLIKNIYGAFLVKKNSVGNVQWKIGLGDMSV